MDQRVGADRNVRPLAPGKFRDPDVTAKGEARASVSLMGLATLWINTGTVCNLTCGNCYIEFEPQERSARLYRRGRGGGLFR